MFCVNVFIISCQEIYAFDETEIQIVEESGNQIDGGKVKKMQGKKRFKKSRQLLCSLLVVVLICGAIPIEPTFACRKKAANKTEELSEKMGQDSDSQTVGEGEGASESETIPASESDSETSRGTKVELAESTEAESAESTEAELAESIETESAGNTEPEIYTNSIRGMLWLDMFGDTKNSIYAGDGIRQAEEQPLADYTVSLYKVDDISKAVRTVITDAEGKYEFADLKPDRYVVGVAKTIIDETEYLLPSLGLNGTEGDNRFVPTYDEKANAYLNAYTNSVVIEEDSVIENMDAGMRTPSGIQPSAGSYDKEIDPALDMQTTLSETPDTIVSIKDMDPAPELKTKDTDPAPELKTKDTDPAPELKTSTTNLKIDKTVTGTYGDPNKAFEITITLKDGGTPVTGTYSYTGSAISGVTAPANDSIILDAAGQGTIRLKQGQMITIKDIPKGYTYTVQETDAAVTGGFYTAAYSGTGTVSQAGNSISETLGHKTAAVSITNDCSSVVVSGLEGSGYRPGAVEFLAVVLMMLWSCRKKRRCR